MLHRLQAAAEAMAEGGGTRTEATMEADVLFHRLLLAASGNALLSGLGACIEEALRASIDVTSRTDVASPFALDKHLAVFEAVRRRDPAAARRAMVALLDQTGDVLERAEFGGE